MIRAHIYVHTSYTYRIHTAVQSAQEGADKGFKGVWGRIHEGTHLVLEGGRERGICLAAWHHRDF